MKIKHHNNTILITPVIELGMSKANSDLLLDNIRKYGRSKITVVK